jgi:hypothetical protein
MELQELYQLNNFNELDLLYKLIDVAQKSKKDIEKVLKGQKEPGIRVRKEMLDLILLSEIIRDRIQIRKGAEWSEKRVPALEKAIKAAIIKEGKDKEIIEKRKQERLLKLRTRNNL